MTPLEQLRHDVVLPWMATLGSHTSTQVLFKSFLAPGRVGEQHVLIRHWQSGFLDPHGWYILPTQTD